MINKRAGGTFFGENVAIEGRRRRVVAVAEAPVKKSMDAAAKRRLLKSVVAAVVVAAASAARVYGITPFGAAALLAFISLGVPFYAVLPSYIAVSLGLDWSIANIITVGVFGAGGIVLGCAKNERLWIALVVYFLFSLGGIYGILAGQFWVRWMAGVLLGAPALVAFLYAGGISHFSDLAKSVSLIVLGCGFFRYEILGAAVFGVAAAVLVRTNDRRILVLAVCYAIGASVATLNPMLIAVFASVTAAAKLCDRNKYFSLIALALPVVAFWFFAEFALPSAVAVIGGALIGTFLPIPKSKIAVEKRITFPVVRKMQVAAEACRGVHFYLDSEKIDTEILAAAFGATLCDGCKNYAHCTVNAGLVEDAVRRAIETGKSGLGILPDAFLERCGRAGDAPKVLSGLLKDYECNLALSECRAAAANLAGLELEAFSQLLTDFTAESTADIVADAEEERQARATLESKNARLLTMCYASGGVEAHLVAKGASEELAIRAMKAATGKAYSLERVMQSGDAEEYVLRPAPKYKIMFGVKQVPKNGEICGDMYVVKRLNAGTVLAVLCDGMGSGKTAHDLSQRTVSVMEACFTAGFRTESVLKLVNALLSLCGDRFSCVDICVIDLERGEANFVKMGGVESVLVRGAETLRVEGGALPLGVAKLPVPCRSNVAIHSGDLIVMVTDGVTDRGKLLVHETQNPQSAAEDIITRALGSEPPSDDMTALVLRAV